MSLLSTCVPVYRHHEAPNLASLAAVLPAALAGRDGELVVALNGIAAGDAGVPAGARTVALARNMGVAPGWNAAAHASSGDVLLFANDDVVPHAGAFAALAAALEANPEVGVVGPVGTRWDIPGAAHTAFLETDGLADGTLVDCEVVSGFLFACRRDTFDLVGGFDEAYAPCSWEEVDFCTAVRAHDLRCCAVAGVGTDHEWGISARQPPWRRIAWGDGKETLRSIHRRNRRRFLAKWAERPLPAVAP